MKMRSFSEVRNGVTHPMSSHVPHLQRGTLSSLPPSPSAAPDIFKPWHPRSSAEGSGREDAGTSWIRHFPPLSKGYFKSSTPWQSQHPAVWVWNTGGRGNRLMPRSGLPGRPCLSPSLTWLDAIFQRRRPPPMVTASFLQNPCSRATLSFPR